MKATSHFAVAHLLYASLQKRGIFLNRTAFAYGNIMPDQTPAMWVAPHFGKVCSRKTGEILAELSGRPVSNSGRIGAEYSKKLGVMCHYICDYFCFAHNEDFVGGVKQHMTYENELDVFLRKNCLNVLDVDGSSPMKSFSSLEELTAFNEASKREYLDAGHTLKNDLTYAFNACVLSIINVSAMSMRLPAAAINIEIDDFRTAQRGYATGDNLIFRMFFFKYRNSNLFFLPEIMPPIGAY
ncbi:MAG: zinc dependent phospholipase C family protein [Oscillospiraceae bacterium]|nr:zinc dependent phospholipase C family protein [Oscillospiraceae bacterium]